MLVIGSKAMSYNAVSYRVPSCDIDMVSTLEEYEQYISFRVPDKILIDEATKKAVQYDNIIVEFDVAQEGNTNMMMLEAYDALEGIHYADVSTLLMLKMSHRFKKDSPHFHKTMTDIKHLKGLGYEMFTGVLGQAWYWKREEETYSYAHPRLKVSKEEFFKDDEVPYTYDHDSIHEAVAVQHMPAYLWFKPTENEVFCVRELFEECDEKVKLLSVYEEATVLALERSLVPYNYSECPDKVFKYALMKLCTSISSGWWRAYAWDNYEKVVALHEELGVESYVDRFKSNMDKVKPFKEVA